MVEETKKEEAPEHVPVRDGEKFCEDDMLKVSFVFKEGYLTTINIDVKDKDFMSQIDLSRKKPIAGWLANANRSILNILSNAPNTGAGERNNKTLTSWG